MQSLDDKGSHEAEIQTRNKSGEIVYVHLSCSGLKDHAEHTNTIVVYGLLKLMLNTDTVLNRDGSRGGRSRRR
jgi:hypothetical protein